MNSRNVMAVPKWYLFLITLIIPHSLWSQDKVTDPDTLLYMANEAANSRDFDQAYGLYDRAGATFISEGNPAAYLKCRIEMARSSQFTSVVSRDAMGDIIQPAINLIADDSTLLQLPLAAECYQFKARYLWSIRGDYDGALLAYDTALIICEEIGDSANYYKMVTYTDLSHVYSNREEFDLALDQAAKALALSQELFGHEHVENGARYYSLGFTYYRSGNYDRAVREIRKGISILENGGGPEMQIGLGYNNLSAVYVAMLDQEGAQQSAEASEQILSKYLGADHEAFANVNWDLAVMYADLDQFGTAQVYAEKAIESFENKFGPDFPQLPDLYHHLGYCLDQQGLSMEAYPWHQKALDRKLEVFGEEHVRTIESYRRLAQHYLDQGKVNNANEFVVRSLGILNDMKNPPQLTSAWIYESHARILQAQGDLIASEQAFDQAIKELCVSVPNLEKPLADQTFNPFFFTEFNQKKAHVLFQGFQMTGDFKWLDRSLLACRETHQGIRKLRLSYRNNEAKLFLQKRARVHYDLMLEVLHSLWDETQEFTYLAEAWDISEQSKSLLLFEAWKSEDLFASTMPATLYDSLQYLQRAVSFHLKNMMDNLENQDSSAANKSKSKYFSNNNRLASLEDYIQQEYGSYKKMLNDLQPATIQELQEVLTDDEVLLEYYLADSSLHIFSVGRGQIYWNRQKIDSNFLENLESYVRNGRDLSIILQDPSKALSEYKTSSSAIFQILLPNTIFETLNSTKHLVIVPDRELGYVSFEALYGNFIEKDDYLIKHFATTYAFSGSLYWLQKQKAEASYLADMAAFAPTYDDLSLLDASEVGPSNLNRAELGALPGAREEVESITQIIRGQSWFGEDATEQNFKLAAADHSILHLALHGIVDEEDPIRSRLLFADDSNNNGHLNAYEIYNLELDANLAVLSACNTGRGKLETGEGILSLSRAFAFAGVPNLVANLWRADDEASSQIMVSFYKGLESGLTKDVALQHAKINYLESQRTDATRHPYFWASHILMGENASQFHTRRPFLWVGMALGLLLILFVTYQRYRTT